MFNKDDRKQTLTALDSRVYDSITTEKKTMWLLETYLRVQDTVFNLMIYV